MDAVESAVLDKFEAQLEAAPSVTADLLVKLHELLTQQKLPKVEELVAVFDANSGDPLA